MPLITHALKDAYGGKWGNPGPLSISSCNTKQGYTKKKQNKTKQKKKTHIIMKDKHFNN